MRVRTGNPFREAHNKSMRIIDWVTPGGLTAAQIAEKIEQAVPMLRLYHRGDGVVNGYVLTSVRAENVIYVSVQLYDEPCDGKGCPANHEGVRFAVAPDLTNVQLSAIRLALPELPQHTITDQRAAPVLRSLGFTDSDGPLLVGTP